MKSCRAAPAWLAALVLTACATQGPAPLETPAMPAQWQAPLPHNGSVTDLTTWWQRQGDPLLVRLIAQAQAASPSLATARSRMVQARAARVASGAALLPALDGVASIERASAQPPLPLGSTAQAGLQASWEIDLFGANRATRDAAQARLEGAQAGWHEARVSLAAEVANQYYGLRSCEQLLAVARQDATSRADTARLTGQSADAGFQPPSSAALARASAAEGRVRATLQRAQCDLDVKALVALSALPEAQLRQELAASSAVPAPEIAIATLPAQTLSQRPDVFAAEREVTAASLDVGSARARRYPRLSLAGLVGAANFRSDGTSTSLSAWTIGPLALDLPLFDAGRRSANVAAAGARYDAAVIQYHASVRQAVREVEEALVRLQSSLERTDDARIALEGYRASFAAADSRYQNGMASLLELEDTRRTRLAAENAVLSLQLERDSAWIALYRAAGGGWTGTE